MPSKTRAEAHRPKVGLVGAMRRLCLGVSVVTLVFYGKRSSGALEEPRSCSCGGQARLSLTSTRCWAEETAPEDESRRLWVCALGTWRAWE